MSPATTRQPAPVASGACVLPAIEARYGTTHPAIVAAIEARADVGAATYGVRGVHVEDGRDHGADAYQELLDAVQYASAEWAKSLDPQWLAVADEAVILAERVRRLVGAK